MLYIGIDLGRNHDHTAIAILQRVQNHSGPHLLVRFLERLPLGTPYPLVVDHIADLVSNCRECALIVDATGVGAPVVDSLRRAGLACEISAVTITAGERESHTGSHYSVPKQDLIAGLQLAMEQNELRVARSLPDAGALVRELLSVRIRSGFGQSGSRSLRIGADGYGEHDDLVIALSLACWRARRRRNPLPVGP
jgi:hypothetical protein